MQCFLSAALAATVWDIVGHLIGFISHGTEADGSSRAVKEAGKESYALALSSQVGSRSGSRKSSKASTPRAKSNNWERCDEGGSHASGLLRRLSSRATDVVNQRESYQAKPLQASNRWNSWRFRVSGSPKQLSKQLFSGPLQA